MNTGLGRLDTADSMLIEEGTLVWRGTARAPLVSSFISVKLRINQKVPKGGSKGKHYEKGSKERKGLGKYHLISGEH